MDTATAYVGLRLVAAKQVHRRRQSSALQCADQLACWRGHVRGTGPPGHLERHCLQQQLEPMDARFPHPVQLHAVVLCGLRRDLLEDPVGIQRDGCVLYAAGRRGQAGYLLCHPGSGQLRISHPRPPRHRSLMLA